MAYTNFKPTIWSKQVQMDLAKLMVFREICNTKFQGEAGRGKTVKIVGISKPTVKTYVPGTAIAAAETPTDTSMELAINQYKYTNFLVDDVDDAQAHVDIMKSLMKGSAEKHAEAADTYIAGLLKDTSIATAGNVLTVTITTPEEAKAAIDEAFVKLWNAGVKTGKDTYIVVSPWFYSLFKSSLTEILTNNVEMVERGIFGMYNGAYVKMSNNVATDSGADCIGVMTKDAIAYADGIEEVEAYRPQDSFSDAVKVLHTFGAKVVRPEQIVTIKATKGSASSSSGSNT